MTWTCLACLSWADEVGFWGCATTSKGRVLMLWYDCLQLLPDDVPRRFCSESGEWYRYVATDGTLLDKGFGLGAGLGDSDPRERGLRIRIGLPPDEEHVTFLPLPWPLPSLPRVPERLNPRPA